MAAKKSYPFLTERFLTVPTQALVWSLAFLLFAAACATCAFTLKSSCDRPAPDPTRPADPIAKPKLITIFIWLLLAMSTSAMLLAVTNQMSLDVAVIPFLWVLPLSLYLLSFIIAFDHDKWYNRTVFTVALIPAMAGIVFLLFYDVDASAPLQIGVYSVALFICCMACHGELARLKPHPRYLTSYFLGIAAGGALGGVLVGVVAPLVFDLFFELHLGLLACCALVLLAIGTDRQSLLFGVRPRWAWGTIGVGYVVLTVALGVHASQSTSFTLASSRNFYGVLRVYEESVGTTDATHSLLHGRVLHGLQYTDSTRRRFPTTYYTPTSGIGRTLEAFPRSSELRVGVVGLGVGTLATYGLPGGYMRFYEIDPDVLRIAKDYFTYLSDSEARVEVVLGDARLSMEREAPQEFDILVLDAFSSDAIPVHLLTIEAIEIYRRHLKPDGVIAIHFTSRHFDLEPVLQQAARHFDMEAAYISSPSGELSIYDAEWMLLTTNEEFLSTDLIDEAAWREPQSNKQIRTWTDDYSNLFQVLMF